MNNFSRYRFSDFTFNNYKNLLGLALKNYKFKTFTDKNQIKGKIIFLRHDIEFSISIALRMAEIEAELGIRATYLLQLHSEFYNPIEKENIRNIKRIIELDHHVGLHFDAHYWEITYEDDLEKYMMIDKGTLEQYFGIKASVFSFHNTNSFIMSCEKDQYAGMINTYSERFKSNVGYCADSTGYWRYERLEDRLREAKDENLQILIHDGMWQDEVLPPRQRIFKVIDDRAAYLKNFYDDTLKKFGAKNIDWEKVL